MALRIPYSGLLLSPSEPSYLLTSDSPQHTTDAYANPIPRHWIPTFCRGYVPWCASRTISRLPKLKSNMQRGTMALIDFIVIDPLPRRLRVCIGFEVPRITHTNYMNWLWLFLSSFSVSFQHDAQVSYSFKHIQRNKYCRRSEIRPYQDCPPRPRVGIGPKLIASLYSKSNDRVRIYGLLSLLGTSCCCSHTVITTRTPNRKRQYPSPRPKRTEARIIRIQTYGTHCLHDF